jgi:hypothetical protein
LACAIDACAVAPAEPQGSASEAQYGGDELSADQIASLAIAAGLPCDRIVLATAVALGESGGDTGATHADDDGSIDRGLWQINSLAWPSYSTTCVFDGACNAGAMAAISGNGSNFGPWLAYTNHRYQQFLDEAQAGFDATTCSATLTATTPKPSPSSRATCDGLGYTGKCVGEVSMWSEAGTCRVRDCAGEGKTCGLISSDVGWGCLEGTNGARVTDCAGLGAVGTCYGDVLVWAENGSCRAVDCAKTGRACGDDPTLGKNCVR